MRASLLAAGACAASRWRPAGAEEGPAFAVVGAGLARSGTNSLKAAVEQLTGAESVSLEDIAGVPAKSDPWLQLLRQSRGGGPVNRTLLRSVVAGYASSTSLPGGLLYKEFMAEFPDAKVILTRHPKGPEAWYASTMGSIMRLNYEILNATWIGQLPPAKAMHAFLREMYLDGPFLTFAEWRQKDVALAKYAEWNAEVERTVPRDRLLVFSADKGWGPLCAFLGKPVPDSPFPYAATSGDNIRFAVKIMHVVRFVIPALVAIFVAWLVRRCCARRKPAKGKHE